MSIPKTRNGEPAPWAWTDDERESIESEIRAVVGTSFVQVAYLEPATTSSTVLRVGVAADFVDVGIEFTSTEGHHISAVWQTEGYKEGLSFGLGLGESRHGRYELQRIDVTTSNHWRPLLGRRVLDVGIGWHLPNEGCPEAVWAVRLDLEGSHTVLIALGKPNATGAMEYQPDEVVVVFDEVIARSYRIPAQTASPWDE